MKEKKEGLGVNPIATVIEWNVTNIEYCKNNRNKNANRSETFHKIVRHMTYYFSHSDSHPNARLKYSTSKQSILKEKESPNICSVLSNRHPTSNCKFHLFRYISFHSELWSLCCSLGS